MPIWRYRPITDLRRSDIFVAANITELYSAVYLTVRLRKEIIMQRDIIIKSTVSFLFLICLLFLSSPSFSGEVLRDLPTTINISGKYIFFLHGKIVEEKGVTSAKSKEFGFYEYSKILNVLEQHDFTVISEARGDDTKIQGYAKKIASQVSTLIDNGVPPNHITVAGFSKGGKITLVASSLINNKLVNFVVLAGCIRNTKQFIEKFNLDLKGHVLSIVDYRDDTFSSCENMFSSSSGGLEHKELILKDSGGHGVFYTPNDIWIKPMIDWIK